MFRARLPCHKMPRLPRNMHCVPIWRSPDNEIRKKHATQKWQWRSPKSCACHTERLLTRDETCNVTKCHACHKKRGYTTVESSKSDRFCSSPRGTAVATSHGTTADGCEPLRTVSNDNTLSPQTSGTLATHSGKIKGFVAFPQGSAMPQQNQRIETRHLGSSKRTFRTRPRNFEASVNFHQMSQNAMPATEFARCIHPMQPWQCGSQKHAPRLTLKISEKHRRSPKCCACDEKCNSTHLLQTLQEGLSHRMTFDTLWNMLGCDRVPRLSNETRLRDVWNLQKWPLLQQSPEARPLKTSRGLFRTVANGCGRKRNV